MNSLELGLIGNSRTSALIDRNARIVWWCCPTFDSDPVCWPADAARRSRPRHTVISTSVSTKSGQADQYYERNSAVLVTRFGDNAHNVIEIIDFAPCFPMHDRSVHALPMIVRIIRARRRTPAHHACASVPPRTTAARRPTGAGRARIISPA